MGLRSFLKFFTRAWQKPIRKKHQTRQTRLLVEMLESRELLTVPTATLDVQSDGPDDGHPDIFVDYSVKMDTTPGSSTSAMNASSYVLLGASTGFNIQISSIDNLNPGTDTRFQVNYVSGNSPDQLVVDSYNLFLKADKLAQADSPNDLMGQPGQLIVTSAGRNNVSVQSLLGDGTIGAASNVPVAAIGAQAANPRAVATADLNGDGIRDLVVVNSGTNQALVYLGQTAINGGGYNTTPDATLTLPAGATPNLRNSITIANVDTASATIPGGGFADLIFTCELTGGASATAPDVVLVFLNQTVANGPLTFDAGTSINVDKIPVGTTVNDFDGDGFRDLGIVFAGPATIATPPVVANDYQFWILPGDGTGAYTSAANVKAFTLGNTLLAGIQTPSSIASATLNNGNDPDVIIGGTNGLYVLTNTGAAVPGTFTFSAAQQVSASNILAVAVGNIDTNGRTDFVATTSTNTVEVVRNSGGASPSFSVTSFAVPAGTITGTTPGGLAFGDLNKDGRDDIVVSNGSPTAGQITILRNDSDLKSSTQNISSIAASVGLLGAASRTSNVVTVTTAILGITAASRTSNVVTITTAAAHNLVVGNKVEISGVTGANGTFTVKAIGGGGTTFDYDNTGADNPALTLSSATWQRVHNLAVGNTVNVTGLTGTTSANGTVTVTFVNGAGTTFQYANTGIDENLTVAPTAAWKGGLEITTGANHNLVSGDSVFIAGTFTGIQDTTPAPFDPNGKTFTITRTGNSTFTLTGTTAYTAPASPFTGTPTMTSRGIINVSVPGGTPAGDVVLTTATPHGLATGDRVLISGLASAANNGAFTIFVIDATKFSLKGVTTGTAGAATGDWVSGIAGAINNAQRTAAVSGNSTYTVTTTVAHGLLVGDAVTISGLPGPNLSDGNGSNLIITAVGGGGTTFDYVTTGGALVGATAVTATYTNNVSFTPVAGTAFAGTITAATRAGSNVTITTAAANNLIVGNQIVVGGVTTATGIFTITAINAGANQVTFVYNDPLSTTGALTVAPTANWARVPYSVGATPMGVAIVAPGSAFPSADANQDSFADVVVAANTDHTFTLFNGVGDGTLYTGVNTQIAAQTTNGVIVADVNRDGKADIVAFNNNGSSGSGRLTVFQGLGGGKYGAEQQYVTQVGSTSFNSFTSMAIADIDADGAPDIVITGFSSSGGGGGNYVVGFMKNNLAAGAAIGAGAFTSKPAVQMNKSDNNPAMVAVGFFNQDNLPDLAISHNGSGGGFGSNPNRQGVDIFFGTSANGGFFNGQSPNNLLSGKSLSSVVVDDFDNDGDADIIAGEDAGTGKIYVLYGDGKGVFTGGTGYDTTVPNVTSITSTDINGDGFKDIVVGSKSQNVTGSGIAVLINSQGTGFGLAVPTDVAPGTPVKQVLATDVNQDGYIDILASTVLPQKTSGVVSSISSQGGGSRTRINSANHGLQNGQIIKFTGGANATFNGGTFVVDNRNTNDFEIETTGGASVSFATANSPAYTANSATWTLQGIGTVSDNVFLLLGDGSGAFQAPTPYLTNINSTPFAAMGSSFLAATASPLTKVGTFTSGGDLLYTNLVANGDLEGRDLNLEQGNLLGWSTYRDAANPGSRGEWLPQTGSSSPLSFSSVPSASGKYRIMLDQADLDPYTGGQVNNTNPLSSYSGSHALYQDIFIPTNVEKVTLSMNLYIDNTMAGGTYADGSNLGTGTLPSLNYNSTPNNQQVRVDIIEPTLKINDTVDPYNNILVDLNAENSGSILTVDGGDGIAQDVLVTTNGAHNLANGQLVALRGVVGFGFVNGDAVFNVTTAAGDGSLGANQFRLTGFKHANGGVVVNGGNWYSKVLRQLYVTTPVTTPSVVNTFVQDLDLTAFKGRTIRLRVAAVNKLGRLIVGVDNVRLNVQFHDNVVGVKNPTVTAELRNPAFFDNLNIAHTNDPTFVGKINDNAGLGGIARIEFDLNDEGPTGPSFRKLTPGDWDVSGGFSVSLPNVPAGINTVKITVFDKANNSAQITKTFYMQSSSVVDWQAVGPNGIDLNALDGTAAQVNFDAISGRITAVLADANDKLGNSYFVGSVNGGIWYTNNGGKSWKNVTATVYNEAGAPIVIPLSIGGIGQSSYKPGATPGTFIEDHNTLYASTGVGDNALDSRAGVGVLKSIDGGMTWVLLNASTKGTDGKDILNGARTTSVVVHPNDPNTAYIAVAATSTNPTANANIFAVNQQGAIFKTTTGGVTVGATPGWANVMRTANMSFLGSPPAAVASVTSLVIDLVNPNRLMAGVGNIGLTGAPILGGGLYLNSDDSGASSSWTLQNPNLTNTNAPGSTTGVLPHGSVGRVTVAQATGGAQNQKFVYVMFAKLAGNNTPPNVNWGGFEGLFKTSSTTALSSFTKVMLKQDTDLNTQGGGPGNIDEHSFVDINVFGNDGSNVGALLVDPSDPNVVYLGGSNRWTASSSNHMLLRIDTGNMNINGDDTDKAIRGLQGSGGFANSYHNTGGPTPTAYDPYEGEGVSWYDLATAGMGVTGPLKLLPPAVTSLAFDNQGRLLIGTVGGIWRGVSYGFAYDYTSGDQGFLRNSQTPKSPGMPLTSINGNLQISSMTSVAIDPFDRGVYYTTQIDTGVAQATGPLQWTTQGLTGPANLGIPTAGRILTPNPDPTATADTPVTLYRVWQYANSNALFPEYSTDGGTTWQAVTQLNASVAFTFPAFAISANPTPIGAPPTPQTVLLFGADRVFTAGTSGFLWDSPTFAFPTAISSIGLAPSDNTVVYAGTQDGRVWRKVSDSSWPSIVGTGATATPTTFGSLPFVAGATNPINAVVVNPNDPKDVYVMIGAGATGLADYVYHTTDATAATVQWKALNLPAGARGVPTYALAFDANPGLGAPNGKLYLGTEVGVYYSRDNGLTWQTIGQGMPIAPVVDLKIDVDRKLVDGSIHPGLNVLAAATLGRGVYTINTAAFAFLPDQTMLEDNGVTSGPIPVKTYDFTVNDPGLASGAYSITATSNNQALIKNANISVTGSGQNWTISYKPEPNANDNNSGGPATITVTLQTPALPAAATFSYSQSFVVNVTPVNDAPTSNFTQGTQFEMIKNPALPGAQQSLTIPFTVADVDSALPALVVTATSNNQTIMPNTPAAGTNPQAGIIIGGYVNSVSRTTTMITVNTAVAPNLVMGDQVVLNNVTGLAGINGTYTVATVTGTGFTINGTFTAGTSTANTGTWTGLGANRMVTLTPAPNQQGAVQITVNIDDGSPGGLILQPVNLLVSNPVDISSSAFTDDFNRVPNSFFLGAGWKAGVGDFDLINTTTGDTNSGKAKASTSDVNITFLNGLSASDVSLQTQVVANASNIHGAGLIARYGGAGDMNYYLARVRASGASFVAEIYRNLGGNFTLIASAVVGSGTGLMRFEVVSNSLKLFFGGTLVAYGNDGVLVTGSAGLRAGANATFDDFSATAIPLTVAGTLPASYGPDSFTSPGQLPNTWLNQFGNHETSGGYLVGKGAINLATLNGSNQDNVRLQADFNLVAGVGSLRVAGLVARYAGLGESNMYLAQVFSFDGGATTTAAILKNVNGTWISLGSAVGATSGVLKFEVIGNSLKLYIDDVLKVTALDNTFVTGLVGVRSSVGVTLDQFSSTQLVPTNTSLPYGPNTFDTPGAIPAEWSNQAGDHTVTAGGKLQGNTASNLATLSGVNAQNVFVQADVDLTAATGTLRFAGLVARYSGNFDTNLYLAQVVSFNSGGTYTATILKNVNGAWTQIGTSTVVSSTGTLRFEVVGSSLKLFHNNTLVSFAQDSTFTTGSVGVRTSTNANFDAFQADVLPVADQASPYNTGFDTDGQLPSNIWTSQVGNHTITGNPSNGVLKGTAALNIDTLNGVKTDVRVQANIDLTVASGSVRYAGLLARYSGSGEQNTYMAQVVTFNNGSSYSAAIYRNIAGTWTQLTTSVAVSGSGLLTFDVVGTSLRLYFNNTLMAFINDSTFTQGLTGVRTMLNATVDNFDVSALTPVNQSLPVTETFSTDGQLDVAKWFNQAGNHSVTGNPSNGVLRGNGAINLATVNGLSTETDVFVQANVDLSAATGSLRVAGLAARYSGSGEQNMYLAQLVSLNGGASFTAGILKNVNGAWTSLTSTNVVVSPGALMRFEVVGTSLKLFYNGALVGSVTDATFDKGTVGVRSTIGTTLDNFSANTLSIGNFPYATDNFSTAGPLDARWTSQTGAYVAGAGELAGTSAFNVATLYGVNQADVQVEADIDLVPATGMTRAAGLVARHSGNGDQNFYLGQIYSLNGGATWFAAILKNVNGSFTTLAAPISVISPTGILKFEVVGTSLKLFYGGTLVASASDTTFAKGSVGLRSTINATYDDLSASTLSVGNFPYPTDNFTTAGPLPSTWLTQTGTFSSDTIDLIGQTSLNLATLYGVNVADTTVQADVDLTTSISSFRYAALVARFADNNNFYMGQIVSGDNGASYQAFIYKLVNGSFTVLSSAAAAGAGILRFEVVGTTLRLFQGGTLIAFANDSTLTKGSVGIRSSADVKFDDFSAGNAPTLANAAFPYTTDAFDTPGQLPNTWFNQVGNHEITGTVGLGVLRGMGSLNVATLNGVNQADVSVQANIDLLGASGAFRQAGLVARYNGAGDSNMYVGMLVTADGTNYFGKIYKNVGGAWTELAMGSASSGAGLLRFDVIGNSLRLYFNGTLVAFTNDNSHTSGSAGVRSLPNATYDNFQATPLTLGAPAYGFSDTFTGNGQLSNNWFNYAGNFSMANDVAVGLSSNGNMASVQTANQTNVQIDANVNLLGTGSLRHMGVVARHGGVGDLNMYTGRLISFDGGSTFFAQILKNVNGVWTVLTQTSIAAGTGLIRFQVIGSSLRLFYGGNAASLLLVGFTTDTSLTTGKVGIRGGQGSTLDNFLAS